MTMPKLRRGALLVSLGLLTGAGTLQAAPGFVDLRRSEAVQGNVAGGKKAATVCAACHGAHGIAVVPSFPNLAGQPAGYLLVQLRGFAAPWRRNAIMQGQVAALDAQDMANLAAYFAAQPAPPSGHPQPPSPGSRLYHHGDPARAIPPCQGCHGVDGRGPNPHANSAPRPPWHTWPALAGLPADYVVKRLRFYRSDGGLATSNTRIMHGVTAALDERDMQALAAYIESL